MRRFALLSAVLALAAGGLAAQHAGQVEVGAFGSYTRYDATFGLAHKIGGGVRLGYLLGNIVGVEGDILFQPAYTVSPSGTPTTLEPLIGSASLVVNALHAKRLMVYVLGGYSLLDFGTRAPYRFTDNGAHGGAGVRLFLTERVALRVEGRAIYSPSTQSTFGPKTATHFVGTAGLSVFHLGTPVKDSDHDGVTDEKDACPDTPAGAAVDSKGCPIDSDRDGVYDGIDKCPGTPAGAKVDTNGCPLVQVGDSDRDGVPDDRDKCPGTPAGTAVDQNGCMILFREERAVPTPGQPTPAQPPRPTLILQGVHFQTGRSVLTLDSYVVLDQVAGSLVANPEIRIEIAGYTDSTGSLAVNTRLSNARALAVQNYLARKGVRPDRMVARGYGPANPVAPNATSAGRAENRRVELHKLQ